MIHMKFKKLFFFFPTHTTISKDTEIMRDCCGKVLQDFFFLAFVHYSVNQCGHQVLEGE